MKAEAWIFGVCTIFLVLVTPAYWFITGDWTGTSALAMTTLLTLMVTLYLGFHAKRWTRVLRTARRPRSPMAPASRGSSRPTTGGRCGRP